MAWNKSKHVKQINNANTDFEQNIFSESDDDDDNVGNDDNVDDDDNPVDV